MHGDSVLFKAIRMNSVALGIIIDLLAQQIPSSSYHMVLAVTNKKGHNMLHEGTKNSVCKFILL